MAQLRPNAVGRLSHLRLTARDSRAAREAARKGVPARSGALFADFASHRRTTARPLRDAPAGPGRLLLRQALERPLRHICRCCRLPAGESAGRANQRAGSLAWQILATGGALRRRGRAEAVPVHTTCDSKRGDENYHLWQEHVSNCLPMSHVQMPVAA